MRPLEVVLIVTAALAAARPWTPFRLDRTPTVVLAALPLLVAVLQLTVEGGRWQLVPIWVAVAASVVLAIRHLARAANLRDVDPEPLAVGARRISPILLGLAILTGAGLAWALPVADLPDPAGPYAVGTTTTVVVDEARTESYGPEPGGPRVLPVQVWYPAEVNDATPTDRWLIDRDEAMTVAAQELGLPGFTLSHLDLIDGGAVRDAPAVRGGDLPLVVYAHGWSGSREIHATQAESLASHGYVVVAADHTYGALATRLPDGSVARLDEQALPSGVPQEEYDAAAEQLLATFAEDIEAVLDAVTEHGLLDELLGEGRLTERPVGIVGHSTGGGAAIAVCERDDRCDAVVGYDPWVEPVADEVIGGDLDLPLLSVRSEEWVGNDNDDRLRRLHAGSSAPQGLVVVDGIHHRDLTLLPLLSPLSSTVGLSGSAAGSDSLGHLDVWTLRFLDHHLRSIGADPLVSPPSDEGAVLESAFTGP